MTHPQSKPATTQQHTPGAWTNRSSAVGIVVGPKDRAVATLGGWPNPADVSLIQSAPDLLEAASAVIGNATTGEAPSGFALVRLEDFSALSAAIAKAQGAQP